MTQPFSEWLDELEGAVIQDDYGYEPGEFTVYPELWKPLWREGLTPAAAFRRALDAFDAERRADDEAQKTNWARIQAEDAAAIERYREAHPNDPS